MIKGILIAIGTTIGLLLVPIVHFVSGPIGPFVGGYIGVTSWKGRPSSALAAGLVFGLAMWLSFGVVAAVVLIILATATGVVSGGSGGLIIGLTVGGTVYIGALGTAGAAIGASRNRVARPASEKTYG